MHPKYETHKNEGYEAWIRTKKCLVIGCRDNAVHCHHVWHARRNSYLSVPLCPYHHTTSNEAYHHLEHELFEVHHNLDLAMGIINLLGDYIDKLEGIESAKTNPAKFGDIF